MGVAEQDEIEANCEREASGVLERLIETPCEKSEFNKDIIRRIKRED